MSFAPIDTDLTGRACVVTGASAGIGKEVARGLARLGARVVLACRNAERGAAAARDIIASVPGARLEVLTVDVASAHSVRAFGVELRARHERLDVLVNNAGLWSPERRLGPDGNELVWATNVLGYVRVWRELEQPLRNARGRLVNVASRLARDLDLDDVQFERRPYDGVRAYAQSKQANRMWTWALARRLEGSGVIAHAMHPGGVSTEIFDKGGGLLGWAAGLAMRLFGKTAEQGADTAVWLAAEAAPRQSNGRFWDERREATCQHRDPAFEERLYELCERQTA
jgi:NAD(P)-dependent dehydrogenase (short-subunit alcohol dehydrogenase family)